MYTTEISKGLVTPMCLRCPVTLKIISVSQGSSGLSFSLDGRCGLEFSLENSKFSLENLKELSFSSFLF